MFSAEKKTEGRTTRLILTGRIDSTTAPEFEKAVKGATDGTQTLIMDFSKLDYISSAGLRVLLSAHKTMLRQGAMKVTGANESITEIFAFTGFADILTVE